MFENTGIQIPRITRGLLVATVAVFLLQLIPTVGAAITGWGELVPARVFLQGQVWRLVTYMFLHDPSNFFHLVFNMMILWMCGAQLEEMWGSRRFVWFYFLGGIGSALFSVLMWNSPIIGASGALFALMVLYAYNFPDRQILFFFVIPMPVRLAVVVMGAIALVGSLSGAGGGIAHLTHLGGIVVGLLYIKLYPLWLEHTIRVSWTAQHRRREKQAFSVASKTQLYKSAIDPILKKISEQGMGSLTDEEKRILKRASKAGE